MQHQNDVKTHTNYHPDLFKGMKEFRVPDNENIKVFCNLMSAEDLQNAEYKFAANSKSAIFGNLNCVPRFSDQSAYVQPFVATSDIHLVIAKPLDGESEEVKDADDTCSFKKLEDAAKAQIGRNHGWKTIFASETDVPLYKIYEWQHHDRVPLVMLERVAELPFIGRRKNVKFSEAEIARARELFQSGMKTRVVRDRLSAEFERDFLENSVKRFRVGLAKRDS